MKKLFLALSLSLVLGCQQNHPNVQAFDFIDSRDKSITISSSGGSTIMGTIKRILYNDGWIIKSDPNAEKFSGNILNDQVDVQKNRQYATRYRLTALTTTVPNDWCLAGQGALVSFDLSIVDNITDMEVLTMGGSNVCEKVIPDDFMKALKLISGEVSYEYIN